MIRTFLLIASLALCLCVVATEYVSEVWVADMGNGNYRNPILNADYSDPDVCRAGDDYYMTSSSFNCVPGLQILHSKDMVNWRLIGYALESLDPYDEFSAPQHGKGVWAPAIRYHKGEFYIYWGDPDQGIFMVKSKNPAGRWEKPVLVKAGKGLIDSCPLWDEDGNAYLAHAYAGSRAGIKSILAVAPMSDDGTRVLAESRVVYDGHRADPTIEGPKFYKRNGYYYIFAPGGGVPTGWQTILRSRSAYGPYERKVVLAQGETNVNGPHQGAWVDTPKGENWFFHFQDKEAYGRVVHLQPMSWVNDWPQMGENIDIEGCGYPVASYQKPSVGKVYPIHTPDESDEFDSSSLGLQWQWHANFRPQWYFCNATDGLLRLYSVPSLEGKSLWDSPNLLLQKTPADEFVATTKITFVPQQMIDGERAGVVFMGIDYATLYFEKRGAEVTLHYAECMKADKGAVESVKGSWNYSAGRPLYVRMTVTGGCVVQFAFSADGAAYTNVGTHFVGSQGKWIGAKMGYYVNRFRKNNDGGWMDVDYFRITKLAGKNR